MPLFVKLIGSGMVFFSLLVIVYPDIMVSIAKSTREDKSVYFLGILRIVVGFALMMSAIECRMMWTIFVLGILLIVSGMFFFILGIDRMRVIIHWIAGRRAMARRAIGLAALLVGALIIYGA